MKKTPITFGLLGLWLLAAAAFTQARPTDHLSLAEKPEVAAAIAVLDAWVAATVASREQPGLSLGIVHDQDLIWAKGYGFADLERKIQGIEHLLEHGC